MPRYVKKRVEVDAFRWIGQAREQTPSWFQDATNCRIVGDRVEIATPVGTTPVGMYDWIVRGAKGEIYSETCENFPEIYAPKITEPDQTLPRENGYFFWRQDADQEWVVVELRLGESGERVVVYGNETMVLARLLGGEWWPERIRRPDEA